MTNLKLLIQLSLPDRRGHYKTETLTYKDLRIHPFILTRKRKRKKKLYKIAKGRFTYLISNVGERSRVSLMVSLAMSLAGAAVVQEAESCHDDHQLLRSSCQSVLWNASSWCVRACVNG